MPTVDEIMVQLNGAKFFSKIDLSQAYNQLELHKIAAGTSQHSVHMLVYCMVLMQMLSYFSTHYKKH